jgi:hypothetical protein
MLIGVAGYARSGKDEIGKVLARSGFTVTRFSQVLKDEIVARMPRTLRALATLNGLDEQCDLQWLLEVAKPPGVRELLQEYGTDVRRCDDPDYWVREWLRNTQDLLVAQQDVCVVDVRFSNESVVIRKLGGMIWRVMRPGVGPLHNHASERQDFDADLTIQNDGTIEDLNVKVSYALEEK